MDTTRRADAWVRNTLLIAGLSAGIVSCGGGDHGTPSVLMPAAGTTPATTTAVTPPAVTSSFTMTSLVSDSGQGVAHADAKLINAWGVVFNPTGFVWVANNGSATSTLYDGNGVPQSLVVSIPAGTGGPANPTGIVFNGSQDFKIVQNGVTGASAFIFAAENGTISAWSPTVNRTAAIIAVDGGSAGPVYKGLAIANFNGSNFLYAADFRHNTIDVYDGNFAKVTLAGGFRDPALPAGFAPFGIQAMGNRIYVAYAKQQASGSDEAHGAGLGVVDVFDTGGALVKQLVAGGNLNAPWGMAMAPANFGTFSNDLLVGNFGDGKINAYDPTTGKLIGTLGLADGTPLVIDGLWGIVFGNGVNNQPANALFFTAGPSEETHGLFGRLDLK